MRARPYRSAASLVRDIVGHLKAHGSADHAAGVQRYFKEEVRSHGWYTAELRRYARALHAQLASDQPLLLDVADLLFARTVLEEKALAVTMLQPSLRRFGGAEFRRFETWLGKVASWLLQKIWLSTVTTAPLKIIARSWLSCRSPRARSARWWHWLPGSVSHW